MVKVLLEISTGATTVRIYSDRGGEIIGVAHHSIANALYYSVGFGNRLVEPGFETSRIEWLRDYHGGWQGVLPNVGPRTTWNRMDVGFHGSLTREHWSVRRHVPALVELECQSWTGIVARRTVRVADLGTVIVDDDIRYEGVMPPRWTHHPVFEVGTSMRISTGDQEADQQVGAFLKHAGPGDSRSGSSPTPPTTFVSSPAWNRPSNST